MGRLFEELLVSEISRLTRYCDCLVQWHPLPHDDGTVLRRVECQNKLTTKSGETFPDCKNDFGDRYAILINGNLNHSTDIQTVLDELRPKLARGSRLILVTYNPYFRWLYRLANLVGIRKAPTPTTFITYIDLRNFARLSGLEIVRIRPVGYVPWRLLGVGSLINSLFVAIPILRWLCFGAVITLRARNASFVKQVATAPSLSIIIPARNERGNIEQALTRMPDFGTDIEIIFVEGNSTDGTWEEIERVSERFKTKFQIRRIKQTGKGKNDAVKLGIGSSTKTLIAVLDADLSMPPEMLKRFYDAYINDQADFINGTRLVYGMENGAMRFLNLLGNTFFAKALSIILETKIGDSLCGTKLFSKKDYLRMMQWKRDFGDYDPFGDFDLIFAASVLGLGVVDVPVVYRARTYGSTNISRFRDGFKLLKMSVLGVMRISFGNLK